MVYFKNLTVVAFVASVALSLLPGAQSATYILSDDRVRSLDFTPALGRGYSLSTNTFQSTCLDIDVTSVPSYNYDYSFTDFTRADDIEAQLAGSISNTFAYYYVKEQIEEALHMIKTDDFKYHVVATMRIDRFYSSVREESSPLAEKAISLLDKQDYVGFFKACGPSYVRSIRRAQEVTAVFSYLSSSLELAQEFATGLKTSNKFGATVDHTQFTKAKFDPITSSLEIKVLSFGLGFDQEGTGSLVAPTLDEFNDVMQFAFRAMTQNAGGDSTQIGQVYGIEVAPWVNNVNFQIASKLHEESIEIPLPHSLLAKASAIDPVATPGDFDNSDRDKFRCKNPNYMMDMYGYCCEREALYLPDEYQYNYATPASAICRPIRDLDKSLVMNNMATNSEFVSRLDGAVQRKYNQLGTLEKCVSVTKTIPSSEWGDFYLRAQGSVKFDESMEGKVTLDDLKTYIDPLGDHSFVGYMGNELDEWMDMFYQPCLGALYGKNIGVSSDVQSSYFMAYPWHVHKECAQLSCLSESKRWNREGAICSDSLIVGSGVSSFNTTDEYCSYDLEGYGPQQECKYTTADLTEYQTDVTARWNSLSIAAERVDYMMEYFCMPVLMGKKR